MDLPGCVGFSLVVASGGCSLLGVHGLLIAVASLVASHRLDSGGHRLICSEACGIAPDQGSNLSLLHCQADFFFFFNHWAIREAPQRLFKCFVIYFLYLFLALLGLPCCAGSSLVVISRGCSWVAARGLLMAASLAAKHGLSGGRASILAARGLSAWGSRALEHRLSSLWCSGLASPWQVGSS